MNNLQKVLTFKEPPFGIVTIGEGQLGYIKKTNIRLRRNIKGNIYFPIKGDKRYVQDPNDEKTFNLVE